MYTSLISYRAAIQPHAPAIIAPNGEVSYAQFDGHINRAAHALNSLLPPQPSRVAVQVEDLYFHWLLVLALGRLGHVTVSVPAANESLIRYLAPDVVLTDKAVDAGGRPDLLYLSDDWKRDALNSPEPKPFHNQARPDDPARLIISSGTTGRPKKIVFSHDVIRRRINSGLLAQSLGPDLGPATRLLVTMSIDTFGGFLSPLITWAVGGAVLLGIVPKRDFRKLVSLRPTALVMSPVQLQGLVQALPNNFTPLPHLTVTVGGSALSKALSEQARLRLTPNLNVAYGSTEGGVVSSGPVLLLGIEEGAVGIRYPWVDVEIVDSQGNPVAPDALGEVRIRSESMVQSYLDDDETSASAFRDGWFYPGDLGSLSETGVLKIVGRVSEVMNLGGQKVSPNTIEHVFASCPGVGDAAAFSVPDDHGIEQPFVAIVQTEGFNQSHLTEICRKRLSGLPAIRIVRIPSIPRNQMGKVQRNFLRDAVLRSIQSRQSAA